MDQSANRYEVSVRLYESLSKISDFYTFQRLAREKLNQSRQGTVAVLNIRQFKFINEIFGRMIGDELLTGVIESLKRQQNPEDLICRMGADVFYLYFNLWEKEKVQMHLEDILADVSRTSQEILKESQASFYCGVVISVLDPPDQCYTLDQMLSHVMYAVDKARESPGNAIWYFDAILHQKELQENDIEIHMHQALEKEEFQLYLQPKIDLADGRLTGAEALVRWLRAGQLLPPGVFIPVFEKTGFCSRLDWYMLRKTCRLLKQWIEKGLAWVPISVNQTRKTLYEKNYLEELMRLKDSCQIPEQVLTIEILESMAFGNLGEANEILEKIKAVGVRISLDDFGSGYSSLNVLAKLNIDELKIDQAFLRGMTPGGKEQIILETIMNLADQLNITTVIEGVETKQHADLARFMGCRYGQGYFYSKPLPADEFTEKYLTNRPRGYIFSSK